VVPAREGLAAQLAGEVLRLPMDLLVSQQVRFVLEAFITQSAVKDKYWHCQVPFDMLVMVIFCIQLRCAGIARKLAR
jgi:hypothetical protein